MKKLLWILPLLFLFACNSNYRASRGPADWIYVSTTGNDGTGNGTAAAPYATIAAGISHASAGDTVFVVAGSYTISTQVAVPVQISLYTNQSVTLTAGAALNPMFLLSSATAGTTGNQSISGFTINGDSTAIRAIFVKCRSNVKLHDLTITDCVSKGIEFDADETKSGGYGGSEGAAPSVYDTGNEIYNCTLTNNKANIMIGGQDGLKVYNNTITETRQYAAGVGGHILSAWGAWFKGLKFYNNKCYKNLLDAAGNWNFHMELGTTRGGNEMYGNEFHNGIGISIGAWQNLRGTYAYSWWIHDNIYKLDRQLAGTEESHLSNAITVEGTCEYVIIERNLFENYPIGVYASILQSPRYHNDIRIRYNLFKNIGYSNTYWSFFVNFSNTLAPPITNTCTNWYIDNNTMQGSGVYGGVMISANNVISNVWIRNNIMTNVNGYGWLAFMNLEGTAQGEVENITATNNIVYNSTGNLTYTKEADVDVTNLVLSGNLTSNPLLNISGNLRLQSTSPAINAGTNVSLVADYFGHTVPQNDTVDIGAHEYGDYLVRLPSGNFLRTANGKLLITH